MTVVDTKVFQPFEDGTDRLLEHLTNLTDQIRARAFDLSTTHLHGGGDPVADWLQAEKELLSCQRCEVREDGSNFIAEVDAAEFTPQELKVSILGHDLMIEGASHRKETVDGVETVTDGRSIMVRAFLPETYDPATTKAELDAGVLRITAKRPAGKAGLPVERPAMALAVGS